MPLARSARAGARVGAELAHLFVRPLFRVEEANLTARVDKLARELDRFGHLLHRQVPNAAEPAATARTEVVELGAAVGADEVAAVALVDWR